MDHTQVIIRPVVSEKTYVLSAANRYTFRVHPDAHKTQIRQAVRGAVRRSRGRGQDDERQAQAQAPGHHERADARVEEGHRAAARGRETSRSSRAWRPSTRSPRDGHPQAQAHEPRKPVRLLPGLRRDHQVRAREDARRRAQEERRAQRPRAQDLPPSRRRRQARLPAGRLQAPQGRRRREGGRDRVRPQPLLLHRPAALRRRREALHPGAPAADGGDDRRLRRHRRNRGGQLHGARAHAGGHGGAQRRAAAGPRRPDGALGRRLGAADGQGRGDGDPAPALRRDAAGARRMPSHGGDDRQRRSPEREGGQGGAQAPHGRAPADARRGDEPRRPSARRRRGLDHGRAPSGHARGACPRSGIARARRTRRSDSAIVRGRRRGKGKQR